MTHSKSPTISPSEVPRLIVVIWDDGVKQFILTHIQYGACGPSTYEGGVNVMLLGTSLFGMKVYVILVLGLCD
jgi:hypothetical protein